MSSIQDLKNEAYRVRQELDHPQAQKVAELAIKICDYIDRELLKKTDIKEASL